MPGTERSPGTPWRPCPPGTALGVVMWPDADRARAPLGDFPPRWASAWGDDPFGLWADLVVGGVVQRLRWIEPGSFTMGSPAAERRLITDKRIRQWADANEAPQHPVTISSGFWLADTPCTQALWLAVVGGKNPSEFEKGDDAPQRPVEQVSWDDAEKFLNALQHQMPTAEPVLPTDAQWEYACRAGTHTAYWWGDAMRPDLANTDGKHGQTTPVKHHPPNPWGLHDMHGNVWEWCADDRRAFVDRPEVDPSGGAGRDTRVLRGGASLGPARLARSAYRDRTRRAYGWTGAGFRLALRSPSPAGGAGGR